MSQTKWAPETSRVPESNGVSGARKTQELTERQGPGECKSSEGDRNQLDVRGQEGTREQNGMPDATRAPGARSPKGACSSKGARSSE